MSHHKLHNYLRTYRKRSGLSQEEVAFLLGRSGGDKISRYERFGREPNLTTALAYEAVFGLPSRELFAGVYEKVERETKRRAEVLVRRLASGNATPVAARKLATLRAIADPAAPQGDETQ